MEKRNKKQVWKTPRVMLITASTTKSGNLNSGAESMNYGKPSMAVAKNAAPPSSPASNYLACTNIGTITDMLGGSQTSTCS